MAWSFNNSTPQCIKQNKFYDIETQFTNNDLQDVLDGLLKLGVSDNNNNDNDNNETHRQHTNNNNIATLSLLESQSSVESISSLQRSHSNYSQLSHTPCIQYNSQPQSTASPNRHTPVSVLVR